MSLSSSAFHRVRSWQLAQGVRGTQRVSVGRTKSTYNGLHMCRLVPSRTVSLEKSAYERLRAAKRPGESFSQTVVRILEPSRPSFSKLAGILSAKDARLVKRAVAEMREQERGAEDATSARLTGVRRGRLS